MIIPVIPALVWLIAHALIRPLRRDADDAVLVRG
jgi:hypothetical protein